MSYMYVVIILLHYSIDLNERQTQTYIKEVQNIDKLNNHSIVLIAQINESSLNLTNFQSKTVMRKYRDLNLNFCIYRL